MKTFLTIVNPELTGFFVGRALVQGLLEVFQLDFTPMIFQIFGIIGGLWGAFWLMQLPLILNTGEIQWRPRHWLRDPARSYSVECLIALPEAKAWCEENCRGHWIFVTYGKNSTSSLLASSYPQPFFIYFKFGRKSDAAMFTLLQSGGENG